jgi:hypothetical protein
VFVLAGGVAAIWKARPASAVGTISSGSPGSGTNKHGAWRRSS